MREFSAASWVSSIVLLAWCVSGITASTTALLAHPDTGRTLLAESDHKYEVHDVIKLYANKVGPFSNPR